MYTIFKITAPSKIFDCCARRSALVRLPENIVTVIKKSLPSPVFLFGFFRLFSLLILELHKDNKRHYPSDFK